MSGDKSLSIRWVLFSSLAKGISKAKNLLIEAFDVSASSRPMLMPVLNELIKRREVSDIQHDSRIAHHATKLKVGRKIDLVTGKGGDSNENMDTALESLKSRRTVDEVDYDTSLLPDRDDFFTLQRKTHLTLMMGNDRLFLKP